MLQLEALKMSEKLAKDTTALIPNYEMGHPMFYLGIRGEGFPMLCKLR